MALFSHPPGTVRFTAYEHFKVSDVQDLRLNPGQQPCFQQCINANFNG